ncbi:MAG: hypothetical protein ACFFG0_45220 [Candidatus Thorarchaeota archaeon]
MNDLNKFRIINQIEKKLIKTSLLKISKEIITNFGSLEYSLYILLNKQSYNNKYPSIYLISKNLQQTLNFVSNNKICSAGLYFGLIKAGIFYLSIEGAEFLFKKDIFSDFKRLYVDGNGEKSILYGNNILKSMVTILTSNLQVNDFLLIFNKLNEIVAIAKSVVSYQDINNLKSKEIIAITLKDKGFYLRKKQ